jgi:hypothetical protein
MHTKFRLKTLDNLKDSGVDGRILLERIVRKQGWRMWIGFIWFRIRISDRLL